MVSESLASSSKPHLTIRIRNTEGTLNIQNRVHKVAFTFTPRPNATLANPSGPNLQLNYLSTVLFTGPDGTPTTGLDADVTGSITYPGFPQLPVATCEGDGYGGAGPGGKRSTIDSEGLVLNPDGSFWVSDEYGRIFIGSFAHVVCSKLSSLLKRIYLAGIVQSAFSLTHHPSIARTKQSPRRIPHRTK